MKKLIAVLVAALSVGAAFGGEDTSGLEYIPVAMPFACTGLTTYSIAEVSQTNTLDVSPYKGIGTLVVFGSGDLGGVNITNGSVVLQHSNYATGGYVTVSSVSIGKPAATGVLHTAKVDTAALKKYTRLAVTLLATNDVSQRFEAVLVAPHLSD
jgi:hypothetical protein